MPGIVLSALSALIQLILIITYEAGALNILIFQTGKFEAQRGYVTCLQSQSW